ncbi:MAG: CpaF family protein [bacterium]|nr:CpaF family protein [bacterium]MXZ31228.1 CpaF family protein [Acidimicrobiia bacterium]MYE67325.1 CpaF family protein [Acidimicrobiia bacterium]MYJ13725.1 CpaF family protein [Acidimicrobiia bacterium]
MSAGAAGGVASGARARRLSPEAPEGAGSEFIAAVESDLHGRVVEACLAGEPVGLEQIGEMVRQRAPLLSPESQSDLAQRVEARLGGLGPLEALIGLEAVSDVMVNGPGAVWVEEGGTLRRTAVTVGESTLGQLIERVVAPLGLRADRTSPLTDARLPDGSRVNVVMPPVAVDGPYLIIRRFRACLLRLEDFAPPAVAELLRWMVSARANIVVSGGTGAGKTTLLNTMAAHIPTDQRIVTVEDAAELDLQAAHVVRLEARPRSIEGLAAVTVRDLVRNALRMRPDRILVGEVRGAEAFDMLQAMNTGHDGCLSTCHANSPPDALGRLEAMVLMAGAGLPLQAVRDQINAAVDFIVHLARGAAGRRRVVGVAEVRDGADRLATLADAAALRALPEAEPRAFDAPPADPAWFDLQAGQRP